MGNVWSVLGSSVGAVGRLIRRPVALTVVAVMLAVLGASTIAYAVTRPDPNRPPVAAGIQDASAGVPAPVLPQAPGSAGAAATPIASAGATSSAGTSRRTGAVPPPLPAAEVVPLLSAGSPKPADSPSGSPAPARPTTTPAPRVTPTPARPTATPARTAATPARTTPTPTRTTAQRTLPIPLSTSAPVRVVIQRLGVDRKPIALGLTKAGELEVPGTAEDLGWYTGGPTPGAMGAAVIAGHVSYNKPGVFYRLATLQRGDVVEVTRKDGSTAVFTVSGTRTYPKDKFPTADVYGFVDRAALRLITCGGDYNANTRHFEDNIVVYADMTSVKGPR